MDELWIDLFILDTNVLAHNKPSKETFNSFHDGHEQSVASFANGNFFLCIEWDCNLDTINIFEIKRQGTKNIP
jgi:hypothetical protein